MSTTSEKKEEKAWEGLVKKLNLQPHPEGGFFAETYRSTTTVKCPTTGEDRSASTAIYFLITPGSVSRLHRIKSDEVWHFYGGSPLTVVELLDHNDGPANCKSTKIGMGEGCVPQYVVPAGTWFGSFPCESEDGSDNSNTYSLVGCTVAPGFEFADFELASRATLLKEFPTATDMIVKLTEGLP